MAAVRAALCPMERQARPERGTGARALLAVEAVVCQADCAWLDYGPLAQAGDIVLVAGKGHEKYQEIKGVKNHFDDKEVLREMFELLEK